MNAPPDPIQSSRALFEAQVDATDAATRTALRARRREALARGTATPRRWWWPAGGMVTAALVLAFYLPRAPMRSPEPAPQATAVADAPAPSQALAGNRADAAALAEAATLELENDAEFYAWLAEAPVEPDAPAPAMSGADEGWTL